MITSLKSNASPLSVNHAEGPSGAGREVWEKSLVPTYGAPRLSICVTANSTSSTLLSTGVEDSNIAPSPGPSKPGRRMWRRSKCNIPRPPVLLILIFNLNADEGGD